MTHSAIILSVATVLSSTTVMAVDYHTVQKGDTIYSLARRYGLSEDELRQLNGLSSNRIEIGAQLIVSSIDENKDTTADPTEGTYYVVQNGDTLSSIAHRFGLTVAQLKALNGLSSDFLQVGMRLVLVGTPSTPSQSDSDSSATYVVQPGDSLYKIALVYGLSVGQLMEMNGLTSDYLDVGDRLAVAPGGTTSVTPGAPLQRPSTVGTYTVVAGDSLSSIAYRHNMTVDQLMKWNGLVSDLIYPGDRLALVGGGTQPAPSAPSGNKGAVTSGNSYTIQPGDNFDTIAQAYGMTGRQLMAFNGWTTTMLYPGEVIYLPGSPSVSAPSSSTSSNGTTNQSNTSPSQPSVDNTPTVNHEKPSSAPKPPREVSIRKPKTSQKNKRELTDPETKALDPKTIDLPTHEVAAGESLADIAKANQVEEKQLREWNNLETDSVKEGNLLYLKDPSQAITVFGQERPLQEIYPIQYTLQKEEKLSDLLELYPVTEAEILTWNEIEEGKEIKEGQTLTLSQPDKHPLVHQVEAEDSIASIAEQYGIPVEAIREWNGLLDNVIYVGEELAVTNPWVSYHQVQPGETLEVIAEQYKVNIDDLRTWNELPAESMVVNGILVVSDPKKFEAIKEDTSSTQENSETSTAEKTTSQEESVE